MDFYHWNVKGRENKNKMMTFIVKTVKKQVEQADDVVFKNKDGFFRRRDLDEDFRMTKLRFQPQLLLILKK